VNWPDEQTLLDRLRKIEALFSRTDLAGERDAAAAAMEGILKQLRQREQVDPPVEYSFKLPDEWSRRLFVALLRRYNVSPYRYRGQRYTTVMASVPISFVKETLWPEFMQLDEALRSYLSAVTERVIRTGIYAEDGEVEERAEGQPALPSPGKPK
jgi:hypothetical protein